MRPSDTSSPRKRRGGWKKVVGGLAAVALLLPMPALALTFLGSWQVTQNQQGGAPRATVSSHDTSSGGVLNLNLGSFSHTGAASSTVTAARNFTVSSPQEAVTIANNFQTILKNAGLNVTVTVRRTSGGSDKFGFPKFSQTAFSRPRFVDVTSTKTRTLTAANYRVTVTVQNTKDRNGSWTTVSPYQFSFNGVRGNSPGDIENAFLSHHPITDNPFFVQPVSFE